MVDAGAGLAVTPSDKDVADRQVLLEVAETVAVHPEDLLPLRLVHPRGREVVRGSLDDELGRPARRDLVVVTHALALDIRLDPEVRVDLGNDPHGPPRPVGRRALLAVGGDFRWGEV